MAAKGSFLRVSLPSKVQVGATGASRSHRWRATAAAINEHNPLEAERRLVRLISSSPHELNGQELLEAENDGTLLHMTARRGDLVTCRRLLQLGVDRTKKNW